MKSTKLMHVYSLYIFSVHFCVWVCVHLLLFGGIRLTIWGYKNNSVILSRHAAFDMFVWINYKWIGDGHKIWTPNFFTISDLKSREKNIELARSMSLAKFSDKSRPCCFLKMVRTNITNELNVLQSFNASYSLWEFFEGIIAQFTSNRHIFFATMITLLELEMHIDTLLGWRRRWSCS